MLYYNLTNFLIVFLKTRLWWVGALSKKITASCLSQVGLIFFRRFNTKNKISFPFTDDSFEIAPIKLIDLIDLRQEEHYIFNLLFPNP